jgi:hypothetical protein
MAQATENIEHARPLTISASRALLIHKGGIFGGGRKVWCKVTLNWY